MQYRLHIHNCCPPHIPAVSGGCHVPVADLIFPASTSLIKRSYNRAWLLTKLDIFFHKSLQSFLFVSLQNFHFYFYLYILYILICIFTKFSFLFVSLCMFTLMPTIIMKGKHLVKHDPTFILLPLTYTLHATPSTLNPSPFAFNNSTPSWKSVSEFNTEEASSS